MPESMHRFDHDVDAALAEAFTAYALQRIEADASPGGLPIGDPCRPEELTARVTSRLARADGPGVAGSAPPGALAAAGLITADGIGAGTALDVFAEVLEPACLSIDHPGFLSFVPQAPSEVAVLADLVVSACSIYAGSWLEGGGAVWAENAVLRWFAEVAGLPADAGGCVVQGGTNGNLSALVAAREAASHDRGTPTDGWVVVCGEEAHASVAAMARVMGADVEVVPGERLDERRLAPVLDRLGDRVAAVVASAGSTNLGRVDDLAGVAAACRRGADGRGVWFHVDGAYGLAALLAPSVRARFAGIEHADSLVCDPHKWLYAPFDACLLLYRDPARGRAAHTQEGDYLDVLTDSGDWNPSDYAVQLSRRARGLPLWFALVAHGTDAFARAVEHNLALARWTAARVAADPALELLEEPELSVVAFRRPGWDRDRLDAWSAEVRRRGLGFVTPSSHAGDPILRLCFINPRTDRDRVRAILSSLSEGTGSAVGSTGPSST